MNYTNKDFYDYILKIDQINVPLHSAYQKILKLLLKEGLDQPIQDEAMKTFFQIFKIRQYQLKEKELEYLNQALFYDAAFRRAIENEDGSYSIYPKLEELPTANELLQYYSLGLKMDVNEIIEFVNPFIDERKEELKKANIKNYYGPPKYLILRTKAIYDAVVLLNNRDDVEDKNLVSNALSDITLLLSTMLNTVGLAGNEETYAQLKSYDYELCVNQAQYDLMRNCYVKILEQENVLTDISNKIWQQYAQENNGVLIHQLTQDAV